jgi:16S rRNA (guanine527-N7)-methyltransferase
MPKLSAANQTPDAIGFATRELVEAHLSNDSGFIPRDGFLGRIERFATELARWGTKLNLTSAPDDPDELAFHILDSLMPLLLASRDASAILARAFATNKRILDLGSGAGFPGLVLAAASDAEFVLAESRRKRASFLSVAAGAMRLANVRVDHSHRTTFMPDFDAVTARAFARPAQFYEIAAPALKPGGLLMLYASVRQRSEIEGIVASRNDEWSVHEYEPPRPKGTPESARGLQHHLIIVSHVHA